MLEKCKKHYDEIIICIMIMLQVGFNIFIYFYTNDKKFVIISSIFSILIILIFALYRYLLRQDAKDTMNELSDLLETLISQEDKEVFSMSTETLNAKLQFQALKLISILKNKNLKIENDKNEVQSLVSDIAHQLKTPIATLQMYNTLLNDESLTPSEREMFTEVMSVTLDKLTFLVENLIKMSRIESGVIQLSCKENSLNQAILVAIKNLKVLAQDKNIELTYIEKNDVVLVYDKNWLTEALYNILENAIKYSFVNSAGNSVVEITLESYDLFSRITILNSGIGISEEEYPKIFKRFYRGVQSTDIEGLGLGLYISNKIVEAHNGYIKVNSVNGRTEFSVFLPNNKLN